MKGYVQVYTGNGKGKTTAAFGLVLRAAGAGLRVFIAQFIKGMDYSEHSSLKRFEDLIDIKQYGTGCFIYKDPSDDDITAAVQGIEDVKKVIHSGDYNIVVMDEANVAVYLGLFPVEAIIEIIKTKPENIELIITGRYADEQIIEAADLVTEMKEIKHYYKKGVEAREGIEK